jgi:formylglycine-generating enzyme required for sulfatase activity
MLRLLIFALFFVSAGRRPVFTPPGTVAITDHLFFDACEVSNLSWMEYVHWTASKYGTRSSEHIATLPDTNVWRNPKAHSVIHAMYYFGHRVYHQYPVIGITHAQAVAFCKWRTDRVKEYYYRKHHRELDIEYRLPSESEWELVAVGGSGVLKNRGLDHRGKAMLNCYRDDSCSASMNYDILSPIESFSRNGFGMFNVFGNVAEMIDQDGIAKGGSWRQEAESCRAGKRVSYNGPQSWVGFRCVCVVK